MTNLPFLSKYLNIIEIFSSIQGESRLVGLPTTFLRLAACNLRCSWCDTTYSFGKGVPKSLMEISQAVETWKNPYVCITGGEPLLQKNIYPLMTALCDKGYVLSLETGGSLSTEHVDPRVITILDIKCPGSGMCEKNAYSNLLRLHAHDEVKFVIKDKFDYDFAIGICRQYQLFDREAHVLFSPVFNLLDPKVLAQWILDDKIKARLNLQMHKFIWGSETRGV